LPRAVRFGTAGATGTGLVAAIMGLMFINLAGFQIVWFTTVLSAAGGLPWVGPVVVVVAVAAHLRLMPGVCSSEGMLLGAAAVVGYALDCILFVSGLLSAMPGAELFGPSPLWMVGLWIAFAATLRHSLAWLGSRYFLGAVVGAVAGPLAYRGGELLGALSIDGTPGLLAVSIEYLIAMPALMWLMRWLERDFGTANSCQAGDGAEARQQVPIEESHS
jgi:hypothetical protein